MDAHNISAAIVSLPAPATQFDSSTAASFYRANNEYMSNLTKQYPTRFGFYAGVPSPEDPTTCIAEIRYALQTLGANGINLLTSYGGEYLGLPQFKPVWDELDRLKAIVLIHPGFYLPIPTIKKPFLLNSGLEG
jgi:6-methylsalicylate decarboxylase